MINKFHKTLSVSNLTVLFNTEVFLKLIVIDFFVKFISGYFEYYRFLAHPYTAYVT